MGLLSSGGFEGYPASEHFGAVGAFDFPSVRRWYVGFEEGVKSVLLYVSRDGNERFEAVPLATS